MSAVPLSSVPTSEEGHGASALTVVACLMGAWAQDGDAGVKLDQVAQVLLGPVAHLVVSVGEVLGPRAIGAHDVARFASLPPTPRHWAHVWHVLSKLAQMTASEKYVSEVQSKVERKQVSKTRVEVEVVSLVYGRTLMVEGI